MCKAAYCEYLWILECKIRISVCNSCNGLQGMELMQ